MRESLISQGVNTSRQFAPKAAMSPIRPFNYPIYNVVFYVVRRNGMVRDDAQTP